MRSRRSWRVWALVVTAALLGVTEGEAHAYTISSEITDGCHERITAEALRSVRLDLTTAAPLETTSDEQALVDDVSFTPPDDMKDLGAVTLLLGVRDNDLKGRAADDLSALAEVHGDPGNQHEHCLREPGQKEPGGTAASLESCRAFIRQRVTEALAGLDSSGRPDLSKRIALTVHLNMRGTIDATLPTFYVRLGQAIHTLQDSFTHTYRTTDSLQVTVAMDWLDQVDGTLDESQDGPPHETELDRCDDPDAFRTKRRQIATEASIALLRATLDPTKTNDEKLAAVDALIVQYLGYSSGCTFDNQWCNATENQYRDPKGCGCGFANTGGGLGAAASLTAIGLLAMRRRRRLASRRRRAVSAAPSVIAIGAVLLIASRARADDASPPIATGTPDPSPSPSPSPKTEDVHKVPPPTVVPVPQPGPVDPSETAIGGYAGISGSIDKPAMAGTLGGRLRINKRWAFGLDGEWNPWMAFTGKTVRAGSFNVYGTAMLRFPLAYEKFNLRIGVSLGTSTLLMNLYGAPKGSTGVFLGVSPLALEWKLSSVFYWVIAPINIALPIPKTSGVPLLYPQYRLSLGLEFYAG